MGGNRRLRNSHVVSYEEINTDHFQFQPRITQPRLLREERRISFEEIDLRISTNLAIGRRTGASTAEYATSATTATCSALIFSVSGKSQEGRHINYDYCKGCGLCVVECPRNAMTLEEENR